MKKILSILFIVSLLFYSCSAVKPINTGKTSKITLKKLIKKTNNHNFSAENYSSRFEVKFENKNQNFSGRGKIKVLKDSIIWGSLNFMGIPAAKFLITPNKIQFYNKVDQTYYDGDFQAVYELTGTKLSFIDIQNLLFANLIKPIKENKFQFQNKISKYLLMSTNPKDKIQEINIIPKYKVGKFIFKPNNGQTFTVLYPGFYKIKNQIIPSEIRIKTAGTNNDLFLKIKFKNPQINQKQTYPFKIPSNYSKLK